MNHPRTRNTRSIIFKNKFLALILLIIPAFSAACAPVINEDPEYVDFSAEDTAVEEEMEDAVEETDNISEEGLFVEQGDIRIYYDASVENYVDDAGEVFPPADGNEMYSPANPGYVDFNFSPMQAHIYVARVDAYEEAAEFAPALIADLQRLIDGAEDFGSCVPELPLGTFFQDCSHQQFVSNSARIPFGNGSGVRFVTVYAIQDLAPVGNDLLVYVFQGFTDDGQYYVKAIVEMMHAQLGGMGEIPAEIYAADAETVDTYFTQFADTLNANEGEFTPELEWIDSVIAALAIE